MSSDVKIQDEVLREAADLVMRACPSVSATENTDRIVALSEALLAAEQRGMEKARQSLAKAEQALKDWLHVYAPDLCKPEEVEAAENRIGEHGTIAYIADARAAIRSLGEKI